MGVVDPLSGPKPKPDTDHADETDYTDKIRSFYSVVKGGNSPEFAYRDLFWIREIRSTLLSGSCSWQQTREPTCCAVVNRRVSNDLRRPHFLTRTD